MYKTLEKIFYQNPDNYESIYLSRFNGESTERIKFSYLLNEAFFVYTKDITNLISSIHRTNTQVKVLINNLPKVAIDAFTKKCLIDEIMQTNEIEGVHSTRKEITSVLERPSVKKRFNGIVNKYLKLQTNSTVKTCEDVRSIYNEIVYDEIKNDDEKSLPDGQIFRKESVSVYSPTNVELHKGLYPEAKIISAMNEALNILNSEEIEPLISISIFHYLFGYIHPFYDDNGRTDRFISSYYLTRYLNPLIGYRLSYTIKENQKKYYDAFEITNNPRSKGDLTYFIISFLETLYFSMDNLCKALNARRDSLASFHKRIEKIVSESDKKEKEKEKYFELLFLLIQVELFSKEGISIIDIADYLKLSKQSINNLLANQLIYKYIKIDKKRKAYKYSVDLDIIKKDTESSD